MLLDLRDKYSDFRIWAIRNRDILKYVQERVFSNREIDLENLKSHSQEWALVNLWGLEPPEKYSEEDIFRDIIVYLQVTDDRKMRGKLAAALSDHEDAVTYLDEVISSVLSWKGGEVSLNLNELFLSSWRRLLLPIQVHHGCSPYCTPSM